MQLVCERQQCNSQTYQMPLGFRHLLRNFAKHFKQTGRVHIQRSIDAVDEQSRHATGEQKRAINAQSLQVAAIMQDTGVGRGRCRDIGHRGNIGVAVVVFRTSAISISLLRPLEVCRRLGATDRGRTFRRSLQGVQVAHVRILTQMPVQPRLEAETALGGGGGAAASVARWLATTPRLRAREPICRGGRCHQTAQQRLVCSTGNAGGMIWFAGLWPRKRAKTAARGRCIGHGNALLL